MDRKLSISTWNIAAINNNPFEYWVTFPDEVYNKFMQGVERFLSTATEDFLVNTVFSDAMFSELIDMLECCKFEGLDLLKARWGEDLSQRRAVSDFLRDKSIGEKRLTSMPDRTTNTIHLSDGSRIMRPSVINAYDGCLLTSVSVWWTEWKRFMFLTKVQIFNAKKNDQSKPQFVYSLIEPIRGSKYPAITADEEAIGVPLQILCLAILDSIFIHIVNRVSSSSWENIRKEICQSLVRGKDDRVCQIIARHYEGTDVFFLQEAGSALIRKARQDAALSAKFALLLPNRLDAQRDQNSLILVHRSRFNEASCVDVTQQVVYNCIYINVWLYSLSLTIYTYISLWT
jgi:hypothetical protein